MEWLAIAGFVVHLIVLIAGVVWVIGKINTQTAVLTKAVEELTKTHVELRKWVSKIDTKVDDHDVRVAVLESREK